MQDQDVLSAEEERRLILLAKAGDIEARNRVIMGIYPMLMREAGKIARSGNYRIGPLELAQIGVLHATKSFIGFDPERGFRLSTYLMPFCIGEMVTFAAQLDRVIPLPRNSRYYQSRDPDTAAKLAVARKGCVSTDSFVVSAGGKHRHIVLGETLMDHRETAPFEEASRAEQCGRFEEWIACVPAAWRKVLRMRYLDNKTLKEVGDILGVTRERVRQIQEKSLQRIHRQMRRAVKKAPKVERQSA